MAFQVRSPEKPGGSKTRGVAIEAEDLADEDFSQALRDLPNEKRVVRSAPDDSWKDQVVESLQR
jgi:hypothetical protein